MSQITLVFGIAPAVAPVMGGMLLNVFGWRAMFWVLLVLVVGVFSWAAASLPETLPPQARQTLRPRALWHNYRTVLLRIDFLLLALIPALNFCRLLPLHRERAGVPHRPAGRDQPGVRLAVRADDRRHHDRRPAVGPVRRPPVAATDDPSRLRADVGRRRGQPRVLRVPAAGGCLERAADHDLHAWAAAWSCRR